MCSSGPNIYSQRLASLSGDIETPFSLTTTGHQLLLRWSSDHGTNRRGFHIRYVGEYQSMYPAYNHILFLISANWIYFVSKLQKSDKSHGFTTHRHRKDTSVERVITLNTVGAIIHWTFSAAATAYYWGFNVTPWIFITVCCDCSRILFIEFLISVNLQKYFEFPQKW